MLLKHILALVAFVPFVMANQCKKGEFWWDDKSCCLPEGGPSHSPSPPAHTKCPDTHYWYQDKACCAPRHEPPKHHEHHEPPHCPKDWEWKEHEHKCKPCPTPPSPPKGKPSPKPGHHHDNGNNGNYHKKRSNTRVTSCPNGFQACPVSGLTGDYECIDPTTELESCGGCVVNGKGQDCTKIEGGWNVACEKGACKVYTCEGGYTLDADSNTCVPL